MQLMVEQERRYVEQVRQDLATSNSAKLQMELESAVKRLTKLEQQLDDLKAGKVLGDPNQNPLFQMAVPLKLSISDPMLVKPKCV